MSSLAMTIRKRYMNTERASAECAERLNNLARFLIELDMDHYHEWIFSISCKA